jgi:hypothetical protein
MEWAARLAIVLGLIEPGSVRATLSAGRCINDDASRRQRRRARKSAKDCAERRHDREAVG